MNPLPKALPERHLVTLPLCSAIDDWLNTMYLSVYKDVISPTYFQWGDVKSDHALCTIQLSVVTVLSDDFFEDIKSYKLMLYCDIPESSGIDVAHRSSPIINIAHYEGLNTDDDAPDWCNIKPGAIFEFQQPQYDIAELFVRFASSEINLNSSKALSFSMLNWAAALQLHSVEQTQAGLKGTRSKETSDDSETEDSDIPSDVGTVTRRSSRVRSMPRKYSDFILSI